MGRESAPSPTAKPAQQSPGASRYFEPMPLGSNAFAPPLYTPPTEDPKSLVRRLMPFFVVAGAAATGIMSVWVAAIMSSPAHATRGLDGHARAVAAVEQEPPQARVKAVSKDNEAPAIQPAGVEQPTGSVAPSATASATDPTHEPESEAALDGKTASVDKRSDSKEHSSRRRSKGTPNLPSKPSRADVLAAMSRVQPVVKRCFAGSHGVLTADITVVSSGRVASAKISGQVGSIGSCAARAVRKARFAKFSDDAISIRYPMAF